MLKFSFFIIFFFTYIIYISSEECKPLVLITEITARKSWKIKNLRFKYGLLSNYKITEKVFGSFSPYLYNGYHIPTNTSVTFQLFRGEETKESSHKALVNFQTLCAVDGVPSMVDILLDDQVVVKNDKKNVNNTKKEFIEFSEIPASKNLPIIVFERLPLYNNLYDYLNYHVLATNTTSKYSKSYSSSFHNIEQNKYNYKNKFLTNKDRNLFLIKILNKILKFYDKMSYEQEVILRNLHLKNFLYDEEKDKIYFYNFSTSKFYTEDIELSRSENFIYPSPEILLDYPLYTTYTDLWSFGAMVLELLSRKKFFTAETTYGKLEEIARITGSQALLKYIEKINCPIDRNLPFLKNNYPKLDFNSIIDDSNREFMSGYAIQVLESLLLADPSHRYRAYELKSFSYFVK